MHRPMHKRRVLLIGAAMVALTGGLTACGDGPSSEELAAQIDANPNAGATDPFEVAQNKTLQQQADDDAEAAELAKKRRADLAKLDREQQEETDRILNGGGAAGGTLEDSSVPIGSADPQTERFRARLSGACDGLQQRLGKATNAVQKAAEQTDAKGLIETAQEYSDTLNDFMVAVAAIDPPPSLKNEFAVWQDTVDSLSSTVRLWIVSQGDREEATRLQRKTNKLTARFLEQSAGLGITCISVLT